MLYPILRHFLLLSAKFCPWCIPKATSEVLSVRTVVAALSPLLPPLLGASLWNPTWNSTRCAASPYTPKSRRGKYIPQSGKEHFKSIRNRRSSCLLTWRQGRNPLTRPPSKTVWKSVSESRSWTSRRCCPHAELQSTRGRIGLENPSDCWEWEMAESGRWQLNGRSLTVRRCKQLPL